MLKVLITGSNGQLGRTLIQKKPGYVHIFEVNRKSLDLNNSNACKEVIRTFKPDWTINCGAFTNVENAEQNKDEAFKVNFEAPKAFAEEIKDQGGKLLQISTDFVFDGKFRNNPYPPEYPRSPNCIYGLSKAKGEEAVEKILCRINRAIILRTSWLISPFGRNFVLKILDLHSKGNDINVVSDQIGVPTSAFSLAEVCWQIINFKNQSLLFKQNDNNVFHWSDNGVASWYDLAVAIGEIGFDMGLLDKQSYVKPIRSSEYPSLLQRPSYSVLDNQLTKHLLQINGTHWRKSLEYIIKKIDPKNK